MEDVRWVLSKPLFFVVFLQMESDGLAVDKKLDEG